MKTSRKDWRLGRLHFIVRGYTTRPQYGVLLWSSHRGHLCLDVWIHQTLYTLTNGAW